jgi:type IV pilus assembly protein PilA
MELSKMKNQKGFSLVELLVVVIIIAIIAAIAIPSLLASRRAANEASAVQSMRTYHSAQSTFQALSPTRDYAVAATDLTGFVDTLLDDVGAVKSGYTLNMEGVAGTDTVATSYCAGAVPVVAGSTGTNHYGVSSVNGGVVVSGPTTLTCAAGDLSEAGTPVQ